MIIIIDYKMGNSGSIKNMIKKIGHNSIISSDISEIAKAEKLILPGVGAFDNGIKNLKKLNLVGALSEKVIKNKTPIIGICLGMQLFTQKSEEGTLPGLGWVDAETIKFKFDPTKENLKIPHMGWNTVKIKKESPIFKEMYDNPRFYFVHSYHVVCKNKEDILTETFHGYDFTSSFQKENIIGVQFHPEKSHKFGMKLLKNFIEKI